jgi:VCBS repeat-containing protein
MNTAIGNGAGSNFIDDYNYNTKSDYSVYLGANTKASADSAQNEIVIGYNAIGAGTNTIQLGNTDVTNVKTSGTLTAGKVTYPNVHNSTSGQVLTIDGAGTATWAVSTSITEVSDEFTATAAQTTFTISHAKGTNRTIKMYINGIRISNTAYSDSSTTVTYTSANNGGYTIVAGDRIQFDFSY